MKVDLVIENAWVYRTFRQCFERMDIAVTGGKFFDVSPVSDFVEDSEQRVGARRGEWEAESVFDGTGKFAGIQYERGHTAQADAARHVQQRAEQAHQCQRQIIDEVDARPSRTGKGVRLIVGVAGGGSFPQNGKETPPPGHRP